MSAKLNCILLVDDDAHCHFFHKRVIKTVDCAKEVQVAYNGAEALDYLHACRTGAQTWPDMILLDINMPKMNGWEFLEAYGAFTAEERKKTALILLTSSLNPDDRDRAGRNPEIRAYETKIFTREKLESQLAQHAAA